MQIEINKEEPKFAPKKKKNRAFGRLFRAGIVIIVVGLAIFGIKKALEGTTTTKGQYPANVTTESMTCTSPHVRYSGINPLVEPSSTEYKLTMIFSEDKLIKSIFLTYLMKFDNIQDATKAETFSHADFNRKLGAAGYDASKFDNKFSIYDDSCSLTLYVEKKDLNKQSIKFFGLNEDIEEEKEDKEEGQTETEEKEEEINKEPFKMPETMSDYKKAYVERGFSCSTNN